MQRSCIDVITESVAFVDGYGVTGDVVVLFKAGDVATGRTDFDNPVNGF